MGSTDAWGMGQGGTGGLVMYEMAFEWIQTMRDILVPVPEFTYRSRSHKLELYRHQKHLKENFPLVLHVNTMVDPNDPENGWIFDNMWLKNYLPCLLAEQWYYNLMKYSGVNLPGGVTLNDSFFTKWENEKEKLEKQLKEEFQEPPRFFFG